MQRTKNGRKGETRALSLANMMGTVKGFRWIIQSLVNQSSLTGLVLRSQPSSQIG